MPWRSASPVLAFETQFEPHDDDSDNMFQAEEILDEKMLKRGGQYLVKWHGIDPMTGEDWEPSWEPKPNVTDDLIKDWKSRKEKDPGLMGRWSRLEKAKKAEEAAQKAGGKRKRIGSAVSRMSPKRTKRDAVRSPSRTPSVVARAPTRETKTKRGRKVVELESEVDSGASDDATSRNPTFTGGRRQASDAARTSRQASKSKTVDSMEDVDSLPRETKGRKGKSNTVSPERPRRTAGKKDAEKAANETAGEPATRTKLKRKTKRGTPIESTSDVANDELTGSQKQPALEEDVEGTILEETMPLETLTDESSPEQVVGTKGSRTSRKELVVVIASKPQSSKGRRDGSEKPDEVESPAPANDQAEADAAQRSEHDDSPAPSDIAPTAKASTSAKDAAPTAGIASAIEASEHSPTAAPKRVTALSSRLPQTGPVTTNGRATRSTVLGTVPQTSPSAFRRHLPGSSQTTKSLPISQIDPILEWPSPDPKGTTQGAPHRNQFGANDEYDDSSESDSELPIVPRVRFVERIIDGEMWVTETQSEEMEGGVEKGGEDGGQGEDRDKGEGPIDDIDNDDLDAFTPPRVPMANRAMATEPHSKEISDKREEYAEAERAALSSELAKKDAAIIDLQEQLEQLRRRVDTVGPAMAEDGAKIAELEAQAADSPQQLAAAIASPPVDPALLAEKDATTTQLRADLAERHVDPAPTLVPSSDTNNSPKTNIETESERIEFLITECDNLTTQLDNVRSLLERANEKNQTLSEENDFFRTQYSLASNQAVASVRQVNDLEAQVDKLQKQLQIGLKQRNMHYEAIHAKRLVEMEKLIKSNDFLLAQSRRTDDSVRRKASLYDRYKEHNDRLVDQNHALNKRYESLQERNEELVDMNAVLRGEKMGAFGGGDAGDSGSEWSEGDAEDDMTDDGSVGAKRFGHHTRSFRSELIPAESQLGGLVSPSSPLAQPEADHRWENEVEAIIEGGKGFRCKWRMDEAQCVLMFDDKVDLSEHVNEHLFEDVGVEEGEVGV